ncbi:MAG: hypothetical protein KHZ58_15735 [Hungatella hathewayi]|nr:hypothetical protein [Hungatella hathewayi]
METDENGNRIGNGDKGINWNRIRMRKVQRDKSGTGIGLKWGRNEVRLDGFER